jgi:hypothetical protein
MNKIFMVITAILLVCAGALAQGAPPGDAGPKILMYQSSAGAIPPAGAVGPVGAVATGGMFFSAELSPGGGKVITGSPYTATASTEMTQVLGDGNRIVNKTTASLARDSLGRTRREETMGMVGPWQVNGPKLVFINDPTSQTNYVLDPDKQTASAIKNLGTGSMPPLPPPPQPGMNVSVMTQSGGNVTYIQKGPAGNQPEDVKTESLGVQMMEGVSVEGKRVTRTIPAGQIGNVQPIESTSEVWFSPELQVVVMSEHSDPRFGETIYQLTGIQRVEPDHSLFEVPPGYTVRNMPAPMSLPAGAIGGGPVQFGIVGGDGPVVK